MSSLADVRARIQAATADRNVDGLLACAEECEIIGSGEAQAVGYQARAYASRLQANYDQAIAYYQQAIGCLKELGEQHQVARIEGLIGVVHISASNYPLALEHFRNALEMYEQLNDTTNVAMITGNIGIVYWSVNDLHRARSHYERALVLHKQTHDDAGSARVTGNLGIILVQQEQFESALTSFEQAIEINERLGNTQASKRFTLLLAETQLRMGNIQTATELLGNIETDATDPINHYLWLLCSAHIADDAADYQTSKQHLTAALAITQQNALRREESETHRLLRDLARKQNEFEQYIIHNDEYTRIHDEIKGAETSRQLAVQEKERELEALAKEREREKAVLYAALPRHVADRVVRGEQVNDYVEHASVMFVDIVGFTYLSGVLNTNEMLRILEYIFGVCDNVCSAHGMTKVKTIGDSYLAVGIADISSESDGQSTNVATNAALAALAIRRSLIDSEPDSISQESKTILREHGLTVRIGLHAGSVIAGIVGTDRLQYDVWGDTVNVASRMESTGLPGKIHASEQFINGLEDTFTIESRGEVDVKGKGLMKTFWIED